ncbi:hypothetical protein A2U01_0106397, partial [Trifolium medium]|nr:hypothetical protein [Trifolium medium]
MAAIPARLSLQLENTEEEKDG